MGTQLPLAGNGGALGHVFKSPPEQCVLLSKGTSNVRSLQVSSLLAFLAQGPGT